jgi:hypothetical protein
VVTKALLPEDRGKVLGLGISGALVMTAIITTIVYNIPINSINICYLLAFIWISIAISGLLLIGLFFKWHEPKTIENISQKIPIRTISIMDKNVLFVISAISMFFIGNGMAHSLLLTQLQIESTTMLRAFGFLTAAFFVFVFGWLSDKFGRYLIFLVACLSTIISMVLGVNFPLSGISLIFEVAGYYLILEFGVIKLADISPPKRRFLYSGLMFGIIYLFDFIGALIGGIIGANVGNIGAIWISILFLSTSFILVLIVPHTILKEAKAIAIFIISPSGMLLFSQGNLTTDEQSPKELVGALIHTIHVFAESVFIGSALKSIEFENHSLAVLSSEDHILFSIIVPEHNRSLRKKLVAMAEWILEDPVITLMKDPNLTAKPQEFHLLREKFHTSIHRYFPEIEHEREFDPFFIQDG